MAIIKSTVEWHDLRIAPDDMPDAEEEVLVTIETLDGDLKTRANVYFKELDNNTFCWCEKVYNRESKCFEEAMVWYEVVAWAYYPSPYLPRYY